MDSATKEYFHTLEATREELLAFKSEQNKLRFQISKIFEENKKLTNELRENVQIRFLQLTESDVGQLEQKLQAAIESKNAAVKMWQTALQQLEKQEELLLGKKSIVATERNEVEKQFQQMKEYYAKSLNVLSAELSNSRSEISKLKNELDEKKLQLENNKINFDSVCNDLDMNKKTVFAVSNTNSQLEEKIISLQALLSDSSKALDINSKEISTLRTANSELSASVSELKDQNKKLKSEIQIFGKDAKESLLTAQEAILQKKEIIYKEKQYQEQIERLKSSIELEIRKVSMRYKAEIKDIQKKATEKTQSLISDIQHLQKELGDKQSLFERANRERQALESKIDLLFSESSNGVPISNSTFDDMCKRLTMAERSRDEFQLKVSSLETTLQEMKSAKDQEIQFLFVKQKTLQERTQTLLKDFNQAQSDRIKLSDEASKLRKKNSELEKELKITRTKYTKDISSLEEESRQKQKTLHEQKRLTEEHYKNVCNELQKLLDAEFKISNKWKIEIDELISKSEFKINELCQDIVQLKNKNLELVHILHQNTVRVPNEVIHH